MGKKFTREEIVSRFRAVMSKGGHLVAICPGSGLLAKCAEIGGADLITLVHTGYLRQKGLPSIAKPDRDTNEIVLEMFDEQYNATKDIPIVAGVDVSCFPADKPLDEIIDRFMEAKPFSGILNYPTSGSGASEEFVATAALDKDNPNKDIAGVADRIVKEYEDKERLGIGYSREVAMIGRCHERGIFTMVYAFTEDQAARMAKAGADAICVHCGGTAGGTNGHHAMSYDQAVDRVNRIFRAAREANPQVILFAHGGPFAEPADTQIMYERTGAHGFIAGSAVDRIPVERAVAEAMRGFKG